LVLGYFTAALSVLAQSGTSTQRTPNPTAPFLLIVLIVCVARRKKEIGGWLLYFFVQIFIGGFVSLLFLLIGLKNYFPAAWDDPVLYGLFLLSTLPSQVIVVCLVAAAVALLKTRSWIWVGRLKAILISDIVVGLIGLAIDSVYFPDNVVLAVFGLSFPLIFLPYLFLSKRVRRVFLSKDWDQRAQAPRFP
jgi:hypothetical protein